MKNIQNSANWQIFIFFFVLFDILTNKTLLSANDSSRLATVHSLVNYNSLIIDNSLFRETIDKYLFQGHFYSDKPPILSIYAAFYYKLLTIIGITFESEWGKAYYFLTLIVVGVTVCIGLVYLYKTICLFDINKRWAKIVVLVSGAGTLVLPYSTVFNNHVVTGSLLIIGFYYLLKSENSIINSLLAGLIISLAGSIDIAAFVFIPASVLSILKYPLKFQLAFYLPCSIILLIYFLLNFFTSGSLVPPAMNKVLWEYPGSYFDSSSLTGLAHHSNLNDLLEYTFNTLIGNRGLITYSPILIFSHLGLFKSLFYKPFKYRKQYLIFIAASYIYIFFYIFSSNNYSGWSYGVRWHADVMLILCLPLAFVGRMVKESKFARLSFLSLSIASIFINFIGVVNPFTPIDNDRLIPFFTCLYELFQPQNLFSTENLILMKFWMIIILPFFVCYVLFVLMRLYIRHEKHSMNLSYEKND